MAELVVYGRESCSACKRFRGSCEHHGIKYRCRNLGWFFSFRRTIICYLHGTQIKQPKGLGFPRLMLINHNCCFSSSGRFADIDSGSNKAEMLRKLRATEWFKGGGWDGSRISYQGYPLKKWTKAPPTNHGNPCFFFEGFTDICICFRGVCYWNGIHQLGDQPGVKLLFKCTESDLDLDEFG
jgi:hypothetical protein